MENLKQLLESYNINCTQTQIKQFKAFYHLLIEWNKKMNLTAITEEQEVIVKHFFDSLTPAIYFPFESQRIIDIGAGAGFPSIPLKICFPELHFTLIDSLNKRISFLETVAQKLELENITFIHGRAEDFAQDIKYRETYDIVIARAVARLNILSELSLPFVKNGGKMIALKGDPNKTNEEIEEATKAIKLLGGELKEEKVLVLPNNYGSREIVFINKIRSTPKKYPRKAGTPNRNPII